MTEGPDLHLLERRRLALACADVGFFELDRDGGTITLDRRAADLVGIEAEGPIGFDTYLARVDPAHRDRVARGLTTAITSHGDAYHDEFPTVSRRWIAADGRAAHDTSQRSLVVAGLLRDVTLRRTTEDARARLFDEMARYLRFNGIELPREAAATAFSLAPLHERAPEAFASLVARHARLLDASLDRQIYRGAGKRLAADLRTLADQLGMLAAGAADVAELHSRALEDALRTAPAPKATTLVAEGRLIALELMGRLLTFYRKRAGLGALPVTIPDEGSANHE